MDIIKQDSRILIKSTNIAGVVPTIPGSSFHTDNTWLATDLYPGELFINIVDDKVWYRGTSILQIYPAGGGASQDVFLFNDFASFPAVGAVDKIYVAKDTGVSYFWNSSTLSYVVIGTTASVNWASIIDKPFSSVSDIDLAVLSMHGVNDPNSSHYTKLENDAPAGTPGAKVDKEIGMGLSENDFTDYYKDLLDNGVKQVVIEDEFSSFPVPGSTAALYVERIANKIWIWNDGLADYVEIITGVTELSALTDVDIIGSPGPQDGQVLTFDALSGKWIATTPAGGDVQKTFEVDSPMVTFWSDESTITGSEFFTYIDGDLNITNASQSPSLVLMHANNAYSELKSNSLMLRNNDGTLLSLYSATDLTEEYPIIRTSKSSGTLTAPLYATGILGKIEFTGRDEATHLQVESAGILVETSGFSATSHPSQLTISTTNTDNLNPSKRIFIDENGDIEFNGSYKMPAGDGLTGHVLTTDGQGQTSWQEAGLNPNAPTYSKYAITLQGDNAATWQTLGLITVVSDDTMVTEKISAIANGHQSSTTLDIHMFEDVPQWAEYGPPSFGTDLIEYQVVLVMNHIYALQAKISGVAYWTFKVFESQYLYQ